MIWVTLNCHCPYFVEKNHIIFFYQEMLFAKYKLILLLFLMILLHKNYFCCFEQLCFSNFRLFLFLYICSSWIIGKTWQCYYPFVVPSSYWDGPYQGCATNIHPRATLSLRDVCWFLCTPWSLCEVSNI